MLGINRAALRRVRAAECLLATLAIGFAIAAWQIGRAAPCSAIGPCTRFDQVAVFAAGTSPAAIETWRASVLGHVHKHACQRELPCVQRTLRLSGIGPQHADLIAFDLNPAISAEERAAIAAASADPTLPHATLHTATTPLRAAGG